MRILKQLTWIAILVACASPLCVAQTIVPDLYRFSYDFDSGAQLSGSFLGFPTDSNNGVFAGTITVLPDDVSATFNDFSGTVFSWDTALPEVSSSQASLIGGGELAFVSADGSKMDFVLSAGFSAPVQIFLENGIQSDAGVPQSLNNASTNNLLSEDLAQPFRPSSWSVSAVPEPSSAVLLSAVGIGWAARRRRN
jgi:hypothetical protein